MLVVKACYGKETRRFTLQDSVFPTFEQLYAQIHRVFPKGRKYALSHLVFTPSNGVPQFIAQEIRSAEEFRTLTQRFASQTWPYAKLRFNIKEQLVSPRNTTSNESILHERQLSGVSNSKSNLPTPSQQTIADKQEIKHMLDKFITDFGNIMSSTFGDVPETLMETTPTMKARSAHDPHAKSASSPIHHNAYCNVCHETIIGVRFKCLDCLDYDLCESCMQSSSVSHPSHQFHGITTPGEVIVHTVAEPKQPKDHSASCDLCETRIRGDRYKCTNCPDFDVCANCFAIVPEQHPTHIFVKVSDPKDIMPGLPDHYKTIHSARCDVCDKMICGIRYKCLMCHDFDLCMHCEALPLSVHPDTHIFCKIKTNTVTAVHPMFQTKTELHGAWQEEKSLPDLPRSSLFGQSNRNSVASVHPTPIPTLRATFTSDNNMPDGQIIAPGAEFVKSWEMHNDGTIAWPEGTSLVFIAGNRLGSADNAPTRYKVGSALPGEVVDVWAGDMKAPDEPGRYVSYWSLQDDMGRLFGERIWCDIVVPELEAGDLHQSGSVALPDPGSCPEIVMHSNAPRASLPQATSLATDTSLSSKIGSKSVSLDSKDWEEWEEAGGAAPTVNHEIPVITEQQLEEPKVTRGNGPGTTEWVILSDD